MDFFDLPRAICECLQERNELKDRADSLVLLSKRSTEKHKRSARSWTSISNHYASLTFNLYHVQDRNQ